MFYMAAVFEWIMFTALTAAVIVAILSFQRDRSLATILLLAAVVLFWLPRVDRKFSHYIFTAENYVSVMQGEAAPNAHPTQRLTGRSIIPHAASVWMGVSAVVCLGAFALNRPTSRVGERHRRLFVLSLAVVGIVFVIDTVWVVLLLRYTPPDGTLPRWGSVTIEIMQVLGALAFVLLCVASYLWLCATRKTEPQKEGAKA